MQFILHFYLLIEQITEQFVQLMKTQDNYEDWPDPILIGVTFRNNLTFRPDKPEGSGISGNGCSDVWKQ